MEVVFLVINFILAFVVIFCVGILSVYHLYCMSRNQSSVESWERSKVKTLIRRGKIMPVSLQLCEREWYMKLTFCIGIRFIILLMLACIAIYARCSETIHCYGFGHKIQQAMVWHFLYDLAQTLAFLIVGHHAIPTIYVRLYFQTATSESSSVKWCVTTMPTLTHIDL